MPLMEMKFKYQMQKEDKNKAKNELEGYLKSSTYLDLKPEIAMQIAKRLVKNKQMLDNKLSNIKLSILSNFNLDFIKESIEFCLYQRGLNANIITCDYGTMITELINPESQNYNFQPEYILIWPTYRDITKFDEGPRKEVSFWSSLWKISKKKNIKIFQVLFDKPPFLHIKDLNNKKNIDLCTHISYTNAELQKKYKNDISFISIEKLQIHIGSKEWHDQRVYNLCKQPFSLNAVPSISHFLSSNISGMLGKYKKVLILDLDNTLWGGEIGDLGVDNIILNRETSEGESYINFQKYIKELHSTGVILAVCSKNNINYDNRLQIKRNPYFPDHTVRLSDIEIVFELFLLVKSM